MCICVLHDDKKNADDADKSIKIRVIVIWRVGDKAFGQIKNFNNTIFMSCIKQTHELSHH